MRYIVTIELERRNQHAVEDTKERMEQLLLPEHAPQTLAEFRRIVAPFCAVAITVRPDYESAIDAARSHE